MPIDIIEGFDYYPSDVNLNGYGIHATWIRSINASFAMVAGRFEGKAAQRNLSNVATGYCTRQFTPTNEVVIGFAVNLREPIGNCILPGGDQILTLRDGIGAHQAMLRVTNTGIVRITPAGSNTAYIQSTRPLLQNTWHYIEFAFKADDTAGEVKLSIDGEPQTPFVGDTRLPGTDGNLSQIGFGTEQVNNAVGVHWIDDLYVVVDSLTLLGESRIQLLEPNINSAVQFTPSAGVNYENVDDASVDGDGSYNFSNSVGDKDLFGFTDITVTPSVIHAVGLVMAARKEDSGTRTIKQLVKSGVVTGAGDDYNLTVEYTWNRAIFNKNPATDAAWTKPEVNAMTAGYQLVL